MTLPEVCAKCNRDCPEPCEALKRLVRIDTYAICLIDAAQGKTEANVSGVLVAKALRDIVGVKE